MSTLDGNEIEAAVSGDPKRLRQHAAVFDTRQNPAFTVGGKDFVNQQIAPWQDQTATLRHGDIQDRPGLGSYHLLSSANRRRLLHRALELGITHFDTARLYADGMSEACLGEFVRGIRETVSITTTFGLLPSPFIGSMGFAAHPLRKARSVLNKLGTLRYPRGSYTRETYDEACMLRCGLG